MSTINPPYGPARHYTDKYLFFYGYELQLPEATLQQWYPSSFTDPSSGHRFPTAEHYMMYYKAIVMKDEGSAQKILMAGTPGEANRLGRGIKNYDGKLWKSKCDEVVEQGNWLKFCQVEECRKALLDTADLVLVESNPADRVWGIGFAGDDAEGKEDEWGENRLGLVLMKVRERLRKGEKM